MNLYVLIAINPIFHPIKWLNSMFHKILLLIDGAIYWAVSQTYQIFVKLADARIFEDAFFSNFAKRIYAIIGVVMLFYLAYALLTSLVDPDKATSGEKSLTKLAQNIVISLVILGLLPTLFDYAYKIQGIVFKENVIGSIIFGTGSTNSDSISKYGNYMAFTALNPFLNPANYNVRLDNNYSWFDLKAELIEEGRFLNLPVLGDWAVEPQELISEAKDPPDPESENSDPVTLNVGEEVSLHYVPIISTACGVCLLYVIFSFCLDLGVRIVKFAFCQLIAPIPVILRIVPSKKGTFDKWLKLTLTVYFEVFIRVAIMYLVVYFFSQIANMDFFKYATSGVQGLIVLAIILMGLLAFAKQAPKMLSEILGLDSGNINLGIKDKLKAGGFFAATSAIGAGGLALGRSIVGGGKRFVNTWKTNKNLADQEFKYHRANAQFENDHWNTRGEIIANARAIGSYGKLAGKTLLSGAGFLLSGIAGTTSGTVRGGYRAKNIKNFGDIGTNAVSAADAAEAARAARAGRAEAASEAHPVIASIPVIGGIAASATQTVQNAAINAQTLIQGESAYTLTDAEKNERARLEEFKKLVSNRDNLFKQEKAYIDAEAKQREAHINSTMANNALNSFTSTMNADFVSKFNQEFQNIVNSNPGVSVDKAMKSARDKARNEIVNAVNPSEQKALRDLINNQSNKYEDLLKKKMSADELSRKADDFLKATETEIKTQKASAFATANKQIETFRNNNPRLANYIGTSSDVETETLSNGTTVTVQKVNKASYTNRLNEFTLKEDTFRQRKQDKK